MIKPALDSEKDALLAATLAHVPFDGWSNAALASGAADIGLERLAINRLFPRGGPSAIEYFNAWADRRMTEALTETDLLAMAVRDRVATGVRIRPEPCFADNHAPRRVPDFIDRAVKAACGNGRVERQG